uniref:Delta-like protein n=1 Tax=Macrostomum lignano TaxID=282301 RepID=A0A1I8FHT9_9PLAT
MDSKFYFSILSYLLALNHFLSVVQAAGYLQIKFNRYTNHDGRVEDGSLCDPFGATYVGDNCDPVFRLRVNKGGGGGGNLHDYQQPGVYDNQNAIDFGSKFGSVPNPVPIAMNFPNPGHAYVKVDVVDKDSFPPDDPMSKFTASLPLIADNVRRDMELISPARHHRLSITHWFTCYTNFYRQDCNTYCVAQNDDVNGHYTCDSNGRRVCMIGWTGADCTQPDPCIPSPCLNGATCSNVGGVASCSCPSGFTGSRCETDIDECKAVDSPCLNNATCENTIGSFHCKCSLSFTGDRCETDVNECESKTSVCLNNGTCENTFGGFNCSCPPGLTGHRCELDVDECANGTSACANGGTCVNVFGNYTCQCDSGFTGHFAKKTSTRFEGRLCDKDVDECSESPPKCRNGGNCTNTLGSFRCTCPTGLTGRHCEQDIDECKLAAPPCRNNGSCQNSFGGFSCRCRPAFRGRHCEIRAEASVGSTTGEVWKLPVFIGIPVAALAVVSIVIVVICKRKSR